MLPTYEFEAVKRLEALLMPKGICLNFENFDDLKLWMFVVSNDLDSNVSPMLRARGEQYFQACWAEVTQCEERVMAGNTFLTLLTECLLLFLEVKVRTPYSQTHIWGTSFTRTQSHTVPGEPAALSALASVLFPQNAHLWRGHAFRVDRILTFD